MLHVYGDWYLDSDERQFILGRLNTKESTGNTVQPKLLDMSYHPRLSMAATFLLRRLQRELIFDAQAETVERFLAEANKLHDIITVRVDHIASELAAKKP